MPRPDGEGRCWKAVSCRRIFLTGALINLSYDQLNQLLAYGLHVKFGVF